MLLNWRIGENIERYFDGILFKSRSCDIFSSKKSKYLHKVYVLLWVYGAHAVPMHLFTSCGFDIWCEQWLVLNDHFYLIYSYSQWTNIDSKMRCSFVECRAKCLFIECCQNYKPNDSSRPIGDVEASWSKRLCWLHSDQFQSRTMRMYSKFRRLY